jgi:hypothetical protein
MLAARMSRYGASTTNVDSLEWRVREQQTFDCPRDLPMVLDGDGEKTDTHLPMIHIAFSNLKTWLLGTHHGVSQQHLQAYLNEFVFRFNRRFYPMIAFNSILGIAAHASAPTYETLYSGEWTHPIA